MILRGKAHKFGDGISTDHIIPGRYAHLRSNLPELAKHVLEDADPDFVKKVRPGDFVVGGNNFGLGSSREHAPLVIKMAGVSAILAKSAARIFYRNAINLGLPVLQSAEAVDALRAGEEVEVDFAAGKIRDSGGREFGFPPFPESVLGIIQAGGLIEYTRKKLKKS